MLSDERLLTLAISIQRNPGVYALLLGSGVSSGAGILTGWGVVLDLIKRLAAASGVDQPEDLEKWYIDEFGEEPDYRRIVERLGKTPTERMSLLRPYFEPTPLEREEGLKVPTAAHGAIAKLVSLGCIRIILTTNFDRLLEAALEEEGVVPDVISSEDSLKGAIPYAHSKCVIIKLHGDYRDSRIRNTPDELATYPPVLNELLDRIFDEFGLIICGWSGEWDTALRDAISRCPSRRFSSYWLARGRLGEQAEDLTRRRGAEVIEIEDADRAFGELLEKVESLVELEEPPPISVDVAVQTVKRYLSEARFKNRLHDLFREEMELVDGELESGRFEVGGEPFDEELYQRRIKEYEAVVKKLAAMMCATSYYDPGENRRLLTLCVERLIKPPHGSGITLLLNLRLYPALYTVYAAGVLAIAGGNLLNLAAILREPVYKDRSRGEDCPAIKHLNIWGVFESNKNKYVEIENAKNLKTPVSDYLLESLKPLSSITLLGEGAYSETFDLFEYLLSLTYMDFEIGLTGGTTYGRFVWKYAGFLKEWDESPLAKFVRSGLDKGEDWELLKAGFFGGSLERAEEIIEKHRHFILEVASQW